MNLQPMICGEWDGCAVWLQWSAANQDPAVETKYDVRLRFRRNELEAWTAWLKVKPRQGPKSTWAVIPVWREGWQCEAQVRVTEPARTAADEEQGWETATEVTFQRCTALFEFASAKYDRHFAKGTTFHAQVDAAACVYELLEEIEVKPPFVVRSRMKAIGSSGYFQLDHENHFDINPSLGVRVRNVLPSEEDVSGTGRNFTIVKPKPQVDIVMAVGAPAKR